MACEKDITIADLKELFSYDKINGDLIWNKRNISNCKSFSSWNGRFANTKAGSKNSDGYLCLSLVINNVRYTLRNHRVIWALEYGEWPNEEIIHVNCDFLDNRIENLRLYSDKNVSLEYLKSIINYDETTGCFTWAHNYRNRIFGESAGYVNQQNGYLYISIDKKKYLAHRLAWFFMTQEWPKEDIDHINRNRTDNRFCNLREALRSQNNINSGTPKNNTSGFKGVRDRTFSNRGYQSRIGVFGKCIHLGTFKTPQEAHAAYVAAAEKYFGEYARSI